MKKLLTEEEKKEKKKIYYKQWSEENKEILKKKSKNWRLKFKDIKSEQDKERYKHRKNTVRNCNLKRNFGITLDEYNLMLNKQNGKCYICGNLNGNRALAVDHCHITGNIRKLLCGGCNTSIGLVKENLTTLTNMISYLKGEL